MARDLRLQIEGDSRSAHRALDDVADESDRVADTLRGLGREMKQAAREGGQLEGELKDIGSTARKVDTELDRLAREADKAGDQLKQAGRATEKLDLQLEAARVELGRLQKQFGNTGDAALVKDLEKQYAALGKLSRLRTKLAQDEESARGRAEASAAALADETTAVERLGQSAGGTGGKLDFIVRALRELDGEAARTQSEITRLRDEFARTGDLKLLKDLDNAREGYEKILNTKKRIIEQDKSDRKRAVADAEKLDDIARKAARGPLGKIFGFFTDAADKAGTAVSKGFSELADDISPSGVVKAAIGVAAAPAVGTIAGGATLAGGALAGVGLGVAGAIAGNPELFQKKWSTAIDDVKGRWIRASDGFTQPTLHAIDILKGAIDNIPLEKILASASKYVEPLARGVSGFLKPLGEGIATLVEKAGPVVDVLEQDLPILGRAFQSAFTDIGDGADGGAAALDVLIKSVAGVVIAIGNFIRIASEGYAWLVKYGDFLGASDKPVMTYGRALDSAKVSTQHFSISQTDLANAARDAASALDQETGDAISLSEAHDRAYESTEKFKESLKEHGKALEGNSEAALANREALRQAERDAITEHEQAVAAAGEDRDAIAAANQKYIEHLQTLRNIAAAAGASTAALDKYIEEAKRASGLTVTTIFRNVYENVGTPNERQRTGQARNGGQDNFASGGTVGSSGWKTVGEHGVERVWLSRGNYVSTAEQTRKLVAMMGSAASGSGGASSVRLVVDPSANQGVGSLIAYLIQTGAIQAFAGSTQISTRPS